MNGNSLSVYWSTHHGSADRGQNDQAPHHAVNPEHSADTEPIPPKDDPETDPDWVDKNFLQDHTGCLRYPGSEVHDQDNAVVQNRHCTDQTQPEIGGLAPIHPEKTYRDHPREQQNEYLEEAG